MTANAVRSSSESATAPRPPPAPSELHEAFLGLVSHELRTPVTTIYGGAQLLVDPAMSEVFPWDQIPKAHTRMWRNEHRPGNMAVLVSAPTTGLRTFEDAIEESRKRFG